MLRLCQYTARWQFREEQEVLSALQKRKPLTLQELPNWKQLMTVQSSARLVAGRHNFECIGTHIGATYGALLRVMLSW